MTESISYKQALVLIEQAHRAQKRLEFSKAIDLYKNSIELHPTAEAYTYLGWTLSMMKRYEEAIEQCEIAIQIDPSYGNPYNDIGAYLIEIGKPDEAIVWLEEALDAERYHKRHLPMLNLARVYQSKGYYKTALEYYNKALALDPFLKPALFGKYELIGRLN